VPSLRNCAPRDVLVVCRPLSMRLQTQIKAHARSSIHSVTKIISVCFPRSTNTTDVPWPRMNCCVGRHICTTFWSSSVRTPCSFSRLHDKCTVRPSKVWKTDSYVHRQRTWLEDSLRKIGAENNKSRNRNETKMPKNHLCRTSTDQ
jgi:hypothetical protein